MKRMSSMSPITYIRRYPRSALAFGVLLALAAGAYTALLSKGDSTTETTPPDERTARVEVVTVGELSGERGPLVLLGEVRSSTQAELRAQKSGEVTVVRATAGTFVEAGAVLAEIDPASERATLLQAQGALQSAEAQLSKVRTGARAEDRTSATVSKESAQTALTQARTNARTALSSAYSASTNAVQGTADRFFQNPQTVNPTFTPYSATYDERQPIERARVALGSLFSTWEKELDTPVSDEELEEKLRTTEERLISVKSFLGDVSFYVNKREPRGDTTREVLAAESASIEGARASVEGALGAVVSARTSIASAQSAFTSAESAVEKIETGERTEDVASAEAAVVSARGALAQAQAGLERALVRTPIRGTLTSWSLSRGDFVQQSEVVGIVANPGALEIEAFVSGTSLNRVTVGQTVRIADRYDGTVTTRAPGLDPVTKKARITVSVPAGATLANGDFVELVLAPLDATADTRTADGFLIPITAIKVLPQGLVVLSVGENDTLTALPIEEGSIIGDAMLVLEGLSADTSIVRDARGHAPGDVVDVVRE